MLKHANTWKMFVIFLVITLAAGLLPASRVYSQSEGPQTPATESPLRITDPQSIFLPVVSNKFCSGYPGSPFSIQIAGLSDFTLAANGQPLSAAEQATLQAQQMAELDAAFPSMMDALRLTGAGWARVYISGAQIEPEKGVYDWSWYDRKLAMLTQSGVKIIATISNPPRWAWEVDLPDDCSNVVKDPQDLYDFVTLLVNRYQNRAYNSAGVKALISIHDWEIFNEPDTQFGPRCDTGTMNYGYLGAEYAEVVQNTSSLIKSIDPQAKVIMGGIAYDWFTEYQGPFVRAFVGDVMSATGGAGMDALNFHYFRDFRAEWERWSISNDPSNPFAAPNPPQCWPGGPTFPVTGRDVVAKLSYFKNQMSTCYGVNKPIYISEIGHHGAEVLPPGVDPNTDPEIYDLDAQARYVLQGYSRALANGAQNVTWYALSIVYSITPVDEQGLLDGNGDPKKAFWTYQTMTRELTGFQYNRTLDWGWYAEAYVFSNPCGTEKTVAWVNPDRFSGVLTPQAVDVPAGKLKLIYRPDMDANHQPIAQVVYLTDGGTGDLDGVVNGSVRFTLDVEPVIIVKLR